MNLSIRYFALLLFTGLVFSSALWGQDKSAPADSSADSLQTLTPPPSSGVEGPIKYWAEKITFSLPDKITHLQGKVKIVYQNMTLTAGLVDIDWNSNRMTAVGVADSTDSLGRPVYRDLPVLMEKGEAPIYGERLEYDFKHNRGKVLHGRTRMEPGYYQGTDIRKIGRETLLIRDGYFTTCDIEDNPHFCFRSSKMRVQLNKKVAAKPVILYIANVPVMAIPFVVFSLQRGRRSGIILPTYGETSSGGRFLEDFGYYWAPSEYFDATFLSTFYERTGLVYSSRLNYKKRYAFSGNVDGTYSPKDITTGQKVQRWRLNFAHNQKIGETTTINARGNFLSDKNFNRNYLTDFDQRTNQTLRTDVSIKKTLPGSRTLSLNIRRFENLQTGEIDWTFPDLSYRQPTKSLIPYKGGRAGGPAWYNNIRYSYNSSLRSSGSRKAILDEAGTTTGFNREVKSGWMHNITPTFSTKVLKYFSLTPSLSIQELWTPEYLEYRFVDSLNTAVADTVKEFRARRLVQNIGLRAKTTVYGLWEIPLLPVKVIRHKMDPSIGFSYQPDYAEEKFGYWQTFTDTSGNEIRRDRFVSNVFNSRTPSGEQRNMNIAVNNLFQGKVIRNGEERKIDLFRVNFRTAHNFAADSLRWRDLSTTFNSKPLKDLNISANATHSFYKRNAKGQKRNELVWSDGFQLPDLVRWNIGVTYRVSLKPRDK